MRRSIGILAAIVWVAVTILPVRSGGADTTCYGTGIERNTFVRRTGTGLFNSKGVKGRTPIRDSALGTCPTYRDRHSTVHIRASNELDWIEVGWFKEQWPGQSAVIRGFTEWGVQGNQVRDDGFFGWDCTSATNLTAHAARFKIYFINGTNWALDYDDDDNGTYCAVDTFSELTFVAGLAIGETGILRWDEHERVRPFQYHVLRDAAR